MNIIITILLVLAGIIALLLIMAALIRKDHYVKREIVINAPLQKVFSYVRLLKNQDEFNTHAQTDGERDRQFKGTDGTVGFTYPGRATGLPAKEKKKLSASLKGKKWNPKSVLSSP